MKRKKPSGLCCKKGKKRKERQGEREADENWQPTVSVMPFPLPLVEPDALECQLTSCKHSTSVQRPSPQKLSLLNSCVIAGPQPMGAWCRGGVERLIKGKALLYEHCYTDKVAKEETALYFSDSCRQESAFLWHWVVLVSMETAHLIPFYCCECCAMFLRSEFD